jgi:hypothetical protein
VTSFFEEWEGQEGHYDAIVSANAWHWIRPEISYLKAYKLLKDKGLLALFWNYPEIADSDLSREIESITDKVAPNAKGLACYNGLFKQLEIAFQQGLQEFTRGGFFSDVRTHTVASSFNLNGQQFIDWIGTYSNIQALDSKERDALNLALVEYINRLEDGAIKLENTYLLRWARKNT